MKQYRYVVRYVLWGQAGWATAELGKSDGLYLVGCSDENNEGGDRSRMAGASGEGKAVGRP